MAESLHILLGTSACLQWLCHSGERTVARGPLVWYFHGAFRYFVVFFLGIYMARLLSGIEKSRPSPIGAGEIDGLPGPLRHICWYVTVVVLRFLNATRHQRHIEAAAIVMYIYLYSIAFMNQPCTLGDFV